MPRGYLKGQSKRAVGKKAARGGGSRGKSSRSFHAKNGSDRQNLATFLEIDDYVCYEDVDAYSSTDEDEYDVLSTESPPSKVIQCPICCEDCSSLTPLMKNCTHPPCCQSCLREIYINQAQQDITNYPLRCYHPSCSKMVLDTQLQKHQLVRTKEELKKHYRFTAIAKAYKDTRKRIVHCPKCEMPRAILSREDYHTVDCRECRTRYTVSNMFYDTIAAVEAIKRDNMGNNDGWARCPRCKMIISKGWGCDHMICVCSHHFSWSEALKEKGKRHVDNTVTSKTIDTWALAQLAASGGEESDTGREIHMDLSGGMNTFGEDEEEYGDY